MVQRSAQPEVYCYHLCHNGQTWGRYLVGASVAAVNAMVFVNKRLVSMLLRSEGSGHVSLHSITLPPWSLRHKTDGIQFAGAALEGGATDSLYPMPPALAPAPAEKPTTKVCPGCAPSAPAYRADPALSRVWLGKDEVIGQSPRAIWLCHKGLQSAYWWLPSSAPDYAVQSQCPHCAGSMKCLQVSGLACYEPA